MQRQRPNGGKKQCAGLNSRTNKKELVVSLGFLFFFFCSLSLAKTLLGALHHEFSPLVIDMYKSQHELLRLGGLGVLGTLKKKEKKDTKAIRPKKLKKETLVEVKSK